MWVSVVTDDARAQRGVLATHRTLRRFIAPTTRVARVAVSMAAALTGRDIGPHQKLVGS